MERWEFGAIVALWILLLSGVNGRGIKNKLAIVKSLCEITKESNIIRIFIDDIRNPDFIGWKASECKIFRDSPKAIQELILLIHEDHDIEISFDHDLGECDDAMFVASFLEEQAFNGNIECNIQWQIHSMNPVGSQNLRRALESMDRYIERSKQ